MANAKLTTLTPVHIGSGEKLLRNFDFIIQDGKVGFLDLEKVVHQIGMERLPQLTAEIEKRTVGEFLKRTLPTATLDNIASRTIKTKGHISHATNELKAQFRTALEGPCIPGSSLKGSMRTAMTSYLTDSDRNNEATQRQFLQEINWDGRVSFDRLDRLLFGSTANAKSTRFLMVGDIQFKESDAEVQELSYINQLGDGSWEYETRKLQLVECIRKGATTEFQLKLNLKLAEKYKAKRQELVSVRPNDHSMAPLKDLSFFGGSEDNFLANLNERTKKVLQWDINKLKSLEAEPDLIDALSGILQTVNTTKKGEAVLRLGGHTGWHFMTGGWMIYNEQVFTDEMFDAVQAAAQRTRRYLGRQFPKTRKMTDAGLPLGFVKIEL